MTKRTAHDANLDFISAGAPALTLKERQAIANAASYIRTLEGLVRDASSAVIADKEAAKTERDIPGFRNLVKWLVKARALGLTEDK